MTYIYIKIEGNDSVINNYFLHWCSLFFLHPRRPRDIDHFYLLPVNLQWGLLYFDCSILCPGVVCYYYWAKDFHWTVQILRLPLTKLKIRNRATTDCIFSILLMSEWLVESTSCYAFSNKRFQTFKQSKKNRGISLMLHLLAAKSSLVNLVYYSPFFKKIF